MTAQFASSKYASNARTAALDSLLMKQYRKVIETLRASAAQGHQAESANRAADFIEARLADERVAAKLGRLSETHAADIAAADKIKADKQLEIETMPNDSKMQVDVLFKQEVPIAEVKAMINLSNQIYSLLFGDRFQVPKVQVNPRRFTFYCDGALQDLFTAWTKNTVKEKGAMR